MQRFKLIILLQILLVVGVMFVVVAFGKAGGKLAPDLPDINDKGARFLAFPLKRGQLTDNGATPWYAKLGLGTPQQKLKFMIDTGTTHNWITAKECTTKAGNLHDKFDPAKSTSFMNNNLKSPSQIDFGPWGTMKVKMGQDYLGNNDFKMPIRIFLATKYEGEQFEKLACDGGLAVPAITPAGTDSTPLLQQLLVIRDIEYGAVSFYQNAETKKGQVIFGAVDHSRFDQETLNVIKCQSFEQFPELWVIPLQKFQVGQTSVLEDVAFCLDTGSSRFKGDPKFIKKIKNAITDNGRLPEKIISKNPGFSKYPDVILTINSVVYTLKPEQYFMKIDKNTWMLGFHPMEGLDNLLLVGSVFLDNVYSIFYYETSQPNVKAIGLAELK